MLSLMLEIDKMCLRELFVGDKGAFMRGYIMPGVM